MGILGCSAITITIKKTAMLMMPWKTCADTKNKESRGGTGWSNRLYRVTHLVANLGWVDLDLGSSPGWWPLL